MRVEPHLFLGIRNAVWRFANDPLGVAQLFLHCRISEEPIENTKAMLFV